MVRDVASGGSLALGELIDQHGSAIYSDLLSVYGVDLIEVIAGRSPHTPRVLLGLIEHLPEGCALPAAMAGRPDGRFWTSQTAVLAAVHNALQVNTIVTGHITRAADRKAFSFIEPPAERQVVDKDGKSGARKAFELLGAEFTPVPDELRASA